MRPLRHPALYVIGSVATAIVAVFAATPAASRLQPEHAQLAACSQQVAALEAEVRMLRDRLQSCEHPHPLVQEPSANAPRVLARASQPAESCNPPYELDWHGLKRLKPECVGVARLPPCSVPFAIDRSGVKQFARACIARTPNSGSCDPPYDFDAAGVKRYRRECF